MPDKTSTAGVSERYQGEAGAEYAAHYHSDPMDVGFRLAAEPLYPYLRSSDHLLDFGCAAGGVLRHLAPRVARAEGLEVNPHTSATARSLGFTVYNSLDELPDELSYDVVVASHVLEHVRDVASTLERLRAVLRPGGRLLVMLPMEDWRTATQREWERGDIDHHLYTWTPRLIANLLHETGYEVSDVTIRTTAWHPRLFPLMRVGLGKPAFWAFSVLKRRRELFAIAHQPAGQTRP